MSEWGNGVFENEVGVQVLEALVDLRGDEPLYDISPARVEQVVSEHHIPGTVEAVEAQLYLGGTLGQGTTAGLLALAQILVNAGAINGYPLIRDAALCALEQRDVFSIEHWDEISEVDARERHEHEQSLGMSLKAMTPHLQVEETLTAYSDDPWWPEHEEQEGVLVSVEYEDHE